MCTALLPPGVNAIAVNKIYQSYKLAFIYYLLCSEVFYKARTPE
jgi:hypothetical protein